jgi:hypothetical protein
MNQQQLFDNFSSACIYWARTNGDLTANSSSFTLFDNGSQIITITKWLSTAPQPTQQQLLTITLTQAQSITRSLLVQNKLQNNILFGASTTEINSVTNPPLGQLVYNTTIGSPQIYVGGNVWKTFTII